MSKKAQNACVMMRYFIGMPALEIYQTGSNDAIFTKKNKFSIDLILSICYSIFLTHISDFPILRLNDILSMLLPSGPQVSVIFDI